MLFYKIYESEGRRLIYDVFLVKSTMQDDQVNERGILNSRRLSDISCITDII